MHSTGDRIKKQIKVAIFEFPFIVSNVLKTIPEYSNEPYVKCRSMEGSSPGQKNRPILMLGNFSKI
jgi:hypothetical protein